MGRNYPFPIYQTLVKKAFQIRTRTSRFYLLKIERDIWSRASVENVSESPHSQSLENEDWNIFWKNRTLFSRMQKQLPTHVTNLVSAE